MRKQYGVIDFSNTLHYIQKKEANIKVNTRKNAENKAGRKAILLSTAIHDEHLVDKYKDELAEKLKINKRKRTDKTDNNQQLVKKQKRLRPHNNDNNGNNNDDDKNGNNSAASL